MSEKKIQTALISVYHKDNLEELVKILYKLHVEIYSTGGTFAFIEKMNVPVKAVETLTGYPSILSGRVKTLHPKIFGGILARREIQQDIDELDKYGIPEIDLIIVDLYPFEKTVASGATPQEIIEKIDIGGISLIRAAAKNFHDTLIVSSTEQYSTLLELLTASNGITTLETRKKYASQAFDITSHYDTAIFNYFNSEGEIPSLKVSQRKARTLRYGENPHQSAVYYGDLDELFDQLNGKDLSYNNLVDVDAAISLVEEFQNETVFVIVKHTNACGVALGSNVSEAFKKALSCDPVSAFGGILTSNKKIDAEAATSINELFFEIIVAPDYDDEALKILSTKKNRIILRQKLALHSTKNYKNILNGIILQDRDLQTDSQDNLKTVTKAKPEPAQIRSMLFASKIAKHTKSNTIVLANEHQLLASGVGQTSRVDALKQAIEKAKLFGFSLRGASMASDAFFPFPDCVEIAHSEGITSVIQPGGSIKDQDSIDFCDGQGMVMVVTGTRHFKH